MFPIHSAVGTFNAARRWLVVDSLAETGYDTAFETPIGQHTTKKVKTIRIPAGSGSSLKYKKLAIRKDATDVVGVRARNKTLSPDPKFDVSYLRALAVQKSGRCCS